MKRHKFLNLITADPTFWIAWFLFFIIFHLATFLFDLLLHTWLSECGLWGLPVSFPRNVSFAAFLPLQLQDAFYKLSPWVFIRSVCNKVTQISSTLFFLFSFLTTHFTAVMSHFVFYHTRTNVLISSVYLCFHGEENIIIFSCGLPALNGINYRSAF